MRADGVYVASTALQLIAESDGFRVHCSDVWIANVVDPTGAAVQNLALEYMWDRLAEWRPR